MGIWYTDFDLTIYMIFNRKKRREREEGMEIKNCCKKSIIMSFQCFFGTHTDFGFKKSNYVVLGVFRYTDSDFVIFVIFYLKIVIGKGRG